MTQFTPDIVEKMMAEDSWLRSPTGLLTISYSRSVGTPDESVILVGEAEAVEHPDSAAVHAYLATQYQNLPSELSDHARREIERTKLRSEGREHALDYIGKTADEILDMLPNKGKNGEGFRAGVDVLCAHTAEISMSFDNAQRAYGHLEDALKLSGDNPTVFQYFVKPLMTQRLPGMMATVASGGSLHRGDQWLSSAYMDAKARVAQSQTP